MQPDRLIYDTVLEDGMERLAAPVRAFHRAPAPARFAGRAQVVRGEGVLARCICMVLGLPRASPDCAVEVVVLRAADGAEHWVRTFAGKRFATRQRLGAGRWRGLVIEQVGAMAFAYAAFEQEGQLHLEMRGWTALGVPMPRALGPRAAAFEHGEGGRFNFDVAVSLPVVGRLVHYRGWLEPARMLFQNNC